MFQKQEPTSVRTLNQKAGTPSPLTQMFEFAEWWGGSGDLESGSEVKASASNAGKPGFDSWVGKIPWRRKW